MHTFKSLSTYINEATELHEKDKAFEGKMSKLKAEIAIPEKEGENIYPVQFKEGEEVKYKGSFDSDSSKLSLEKYDGEEEEDEEEKVKKHAAMEKKAKEAFDEMQK